jgi:Flp pilus assembly protein CpaB
MVELSALSSRLSRYFRRHRRLATAALATVAVVSAVQVVAPARPHRVGLVVASHDLASGVVLAADDVRVAAADPDLVPDGAASTVPAVLGRTVAAPMRAGEPVTDRRVLGAELLRGYPVGQVAVAVRIQDADVVSLLVVGERIDVYSATGDPRVPAARVVTDQTVVALPVSGDSGREGALVVLALSPADAARVAQAAATTQLSVSLRGG